jgi:hypothetical protein
MIKQDAFAAVPSRRAVFSEGRGPRAAVRALGSETALQPTSNTTSWLSKADVPSRRLHPIARDGVGSILFLFCCRHPARLVYPLALSRGFVGFARDCGLFIHLLDVFGCDVFFYLFN